MTTRKPEVAIVGINYFPEHTGIAPYTTGLANGLAAAGYQVQVVTGYPHYPAWKISPEFTGWSHRRRAHGVEVSRLRHYVPFKPTLIKRLAMECTFAVRSLAQHLPQSGIVVAVSPSLISSLVTVLRVRLTRRNLKSIMWVQDVYSAAATETGSGRIFSPAVRSLERLAMRQSDSLVVIHDGFKRDLIENFGVAVEKVNVIRNWSHISDPITHDRIATRAERGWSSDQVVLLHAGNIGVKQDLGNVLDAAALAKERGLEVRFVFLGDGNQRPKLQQRATNMTNVEFIEPVDDEKFRCLLAASDILLVNELPSLRETALPSKLTSYFRTGLPVLAATHPDSMTSKEIEFSRAGIRVDAGSPAALLDGMRRLTSDTDLSENLGRAGLRFYEQHLQQDSAIREFDRIIQRIETPSRTSIA